MLRRRVRRPAGPPAGASAPSDGAAASPPASESSSQGVPSISSCDEIGAIVADYIVGIPLDEENSYTDADAVSCVWSPSADEVDDLTEIQTFSVDISEGDEEVPDPEEAAAYGMDQYFTDPRLDDLGGVGLWISADTAVVGGGTGSVLVPGIEITITDARFGQNAYLDKNSLVTLALQILDL
ncbi:hypothetical protein LQ938_06815 [Microbacterium sp. cx-55]|uniref:hypothetical protein n=1 Tax=Microbacterium sp. cx-55 TaxID=2875948 RepID=UPI001CBC8AD0|nr:hypothetical protein [Microbacterium sp. cx-55]MBZ4486543.1 hypothetical protein [Microbacterium sp. cx-55]UGB36489.1 hypothetical protein LQ938_06815 [Microbacterium sp. cx-55]